MLGCGWLLGWFCSLCGVDVESGMDLGVLVEVWVGCGCFGIGLCL